MREKIGSALRFIFTNFGPLILFYGVNHFYGLKPAIVLSTLFSIGEIAVAYYSGKKTTTLFKFSAAITLAFGAVDLYAQQSFLFKYEACVSNVLTGIFFGASAFAEKTLIQEFYEQRKDAKPIPPDVAGFFRFFTLVWALYFIVKAIFYFWVARNYSLEQGLVIRTVFGSGSLYFLIAISTFGSRKIFAVMRRAGFFKGP